jgi:hypothetical protein
MLSFRGMGQFGGFLGSFGAFLGVFTGKSKKSTLFPADIRLSQPGSFFTTETKTPLCQQLFKCS